MKSQRTDKIGKKEIEIIKQIGLEVLDLPSFLIGSGKKIFPKKSKYYYQNRNAYIKRFNNLNKKDIIFLSGDAVKLTKKGLNYLKILDLDKIKIKTKKWDKIWRVVAYDIPDKRKKERNYFRKKLLELGFKKLQESMFVFPYKCEEEIAVLAQCLSVSPYVIYLQTDKIPRQNSFIKDFSL